MDSSGPRNPLATTNGGSPDVLHPELYASWTDASNAAIPDGNAATFTPAGEATSSRYLNASGFGFAIPSDATIKGFIVEIKRWSTSDGVGNGVCYSDGVRLLKNGIRQPTIHDVGELFGTDTDAAHVILGGATDLWGTTWTPANVNASNFGVSLFATPTVDDADDGISTAHIDHIRVTCFFQRDS